MWNVGAKPGQGKGKKKEKGGISDKRKKMSSPTYRGNNTRSKSISAENDVKAHSQKRKHQPDVTSGPGESKHEEEQTVKYPRSDAQAVMSKKKEEGADMNVDFLFDDLSRAVQTKYRIFDQIGKGAFGDVFRAEKRGGGTYSDHKQYAIKVIRPRKQVFDVGLSVETMSELSLLARLKHPNVVRMEEVLYDASDHTLEMVLELADCDLAELIRQWWTPSVAIQQRQQAQVPQMVRVAYQVFCGLNYLHQNGIMHLDVKPSNMLIVGGVAKLADFGLSEREDGTRESGQGKVTWPYRSPELQCNLGRYSADADTWAVGMMLVQMFFQRTILLQKVPRYDDRIGDPSLFQAILQTVGMPPEKLMKAYEAAGEQRCSPVPNPVPAAAASLPQALPQQQQQQQQQQAFPQAQYLDLETTMIREKDIAYYKQLYTPKRYRALLDLIHACLRFEPTERINFREVQEHPFFADDGCVDCACETVRGFHLPNNAHHPLPDSVELLVRESNDAPSLIRYAREIFKRVEQEDPALLQLRDATAAAATDKRREFACACVSIAAKLLDVDGLVPLHAKLSLHAANITQSSIEQLDPHARRRKWASIAESLHQLEGTCGRLLSWNFDGPWHATAAAATAAAPAYPSASSGPEKGSGGEEEEEDGDVELVFTSMRLKEDNLPLNSSYMARQGDINAAMREILVDWLVSVHMNLKLEQPTLFLAVQTLDRFLSFETVTRTNLQLVGCAVLLNVSRREARGAGPAMEKILIFGAGAFTLEQLIEMEATLEARLIGVKEPPLAIDFFKPLAHIYDIDDAEPYSETWFLAMYYVELALLKYAMLEFKGSQIAASAFYLATNTVRGAIQPIWTQYQQEQTGYTLGQLRVCISIMYKLIQSNQTETSKLKAIRNKYANRKFGAVSKLICIKPLL